MIEIKDASKIYENGNIGIEDVNLKLPIKGIVGIFGKSGAGKSTLLHCLGGLDQFSNGDIFINGKSVKDLKEFSTYIFQEYNLIEDFTVLDNLIISNPHVSQKNVEDYLKRLLLYEFKNNKVNELSGGQRQRVEIIRALIQDVDIILCDEPTSNLDEELSEDILNLFKEISREKLFLIVSHDQELLKKYTIEIIEIEDHKISKNKLQDMEEKYSYQRQDEKKLSIKNIFRFIILNMRKAKIKTLMTFLFLFISFSLLFVMISMLTLDRGKLAYNAFKDKKLSYFCVNKAIEEDPYFTADWLNITKEDIKNVDAKIISYHMLIFKGIIDDRYEAKCSMVWELLDSKFRNYMLKDNEILLTTHMLTSIAAKKEDVIGATFTCGPNQFLIKDVVDLEAFDSYDLNGTTFYPGIIANSQAVALLNPNYLCPIKGKQLDLFFEEKEVLTPIYDPYLDSNTPNVIKGTLPKEMEVCLSKAFLEENKLDEESILGCEIELELYHTSAFSNSLNREKRSFRVSGITETQLVFAQKDFNDLKNICGKYNIKNTNTIFIIMDQYRIEDIKNSFENGLCPNMRIFNQINQIYENVYSKYLIVFEVLCFLSILLGCFTIIYSVQNSLIKNKKNLGVFISFHIKKASILAIYFMENGCIGLIALGLSIAVYQPVLHVLNKSFDKQFDLNIRYLMPNYINVVYLLCALFIIIGMCLLYPLIKMLKTKPVELLFDRK